ncbi:MAG: SDR family oxidoreductase [Holophaga sp.]|jgi:NAD(P)-dependent dehydrogenase (short-subunit alcohol dehydrogenase family)
MKGLKGKNVLVTGGASGIGAAAAVRFLDEGAKVFLVDRDVPGLQTIQVALPQVTGCSACDVTDRRQVESAIGKAAEALGGLDVLLNNAGISLRHSFLEITAEDWDRVLAVNLTGAFFVAQAGARAMQHREGGVIINMASTHGLAGFPFCAAYNTTKAGLIELTRCMALELAPRIRVNAVAPGYTLTPMQLNVYTHEMIEAVNRKIPLRRHARPEEVAALCAFLASEDAAYITGQVYPLDGGMLAGSLGSR